MSTFPVERCNQYLYLFFQRFEDKYKAELQTGQVSKHTQFNYAWSLIRSPNTNDIKKGAHLLQGIDALMKYKYFQSIWGVRCSFTL